tara:strand:+ start:420 stop:1778 length:1359 start_codon:yes stop_codon:yes gene_type:complete
MGGSTKVTTQETGPWKGQQNYLKFGFANAVKAFQKGAPRYYGREATAEDVAAGKASKVGDWVYNPTVAGFTPTQTAAHDAIKGYVMGPEAARQQAAANQQLLGTYNLSRNLATKAMQQGTLAENQVRPYANNMMRYGNRATQYDLSQSQYAGMTPFQSEQLSDMLAGRVNTAQLAPVTAAMSRDVLDNLTGTILPKIRESQIAYQPGGSSRGDLITSKAINTATSKLADQASRMYADAYSQAQQRRLPAGQMALGAQQFAQQRTDAGGNMRLAGAQAALQGNQAAQGAGRMGLQALQQYPSIMNAPLSLYDRLEKVGGSERALDQANINADIAAYNYDQTKDMRHLANYMALIQGNYGSSSTITQPGPSGLQTIGQIASIAAPFMGSDARIKENIEYDGTYRSGIREYNVYNYNYVGDDTPRRGVMAQEVELINPDAVGEIDGVKFVNYGAL